MEETTISGLEGLKVRGKRNGGSDKIGVFRKVEFEFFRLIENGFDGG